MGNILHKALYTVILLGSFIYLPFWVSICIGILGIFLFSFEIITVIIFFIADMLYADHSLLHMFVGKISLTLLALFLVSISLYIKPKIRSLQYYEN
jgi:hypothetical protein